MDNGASAAEGARKGRADQRYDIAILAALMSDQNKLIGFAKIANMSAGGAKLELAGPVQVPQNFTLIMGGKSGPRRNCSLVWQSEGSIGVRFIGPEDETLIA